MKSKILSALALLLLATAFGIAGGTGWTDDYDKALEKAKTEGKMVLLDFTGSDWCGWCMKLDKEVFSQQEFKKYARENLVLVEIDFPQRKHISKSTQKQNEELQAKYGIRGYPTIVVLNSNGEKIGELGYMEGGPEAFVAELKKLQEKS